MPVGGGGVFWGGRAGAGVGIDGSTLRETGGKIDIKE